MTAEASRIRRELEYRGISARAVAAKMGIHPGHLMRVLNGEREGSIKFLRSVAEVVANMPDGRRQRQDDMESLINAATHVFFVKRGDFQSAIFFGSPRNKEKE